MPNHYAPYKLPISLSVEGNVINVEFKAKSGPFLQHDRDVLVPLPGIKLELTLEAIEFLGRLNPYYLDRFNGRHP